MLLPIHMHTYRHTRTHAQVRTSHPRCTHDAHLPGSDVRPEHSYRSSVVRAVRSPSLRASERQSHSARASEGGVIAVMMVVMPTMGVCAQPYRADLTRYPPS